MVSTNDIYDRNVRLVYVLRACVGALFFIQPVIVSVWMAGGAQKEQLWVLKTALFAATMLFEVPSGVIADWIGRRRALLGAGILLIAGEMFYVCFNGLGIFITAEVLAAAGITLATGTDQALLYESLQKLGREREFGRCYAIARLVELIAGAAAALISGWLYRIQPALPFLTSVPFFALLILVAYLMKDSPAARQKRDTLTAAVVEIWQAFRRLEASVLVLMALLGAAFAMSPLVKTYGQLVFKHHRAPVGLFGEATSVAMIVAGLLAVVTPSLESRIGQVKALLLAGLMNALCLAGLVLLPLPGVFGCVVLYYAGEVVVNVVATKHLNREIPTAIRATTVSMTVLIGRLLGIAGTGLWTLGSWLSSEGSAVRNGVFLAGGVLFALYVTLVLRRQKLLTLCRVSPEV